MDEDALMPLTIEQVQLYTIEEATQILKVKESKIRQMIFRREITYVKLGGLIRFRLKDLADYIQKFPKKS